MHHDRRITVVVETHYPDGRPGECKYCGVQIVWFTTSPKGRLLPFNPHPLVLSEHQNPDTRVKFRVLSADAVHSMTCRNRPTRKTRTPRLF